MILIFPDVKFGVSLVRRFLHLEPLTKNRLAGRVSKGVILPISLDVKRKKKRIELAGKRIPEFIAVESTIFEVHEISDEH